MTFFADLLQRYNTSTTKTEEHQQSAAIGQTTTECSTRDCDAIKLSPCEPK